LPAENLFQQRAVFPIALPNQQPGHILGFHYVRHQDLPYNRYKNSASLQEWIERAAVA
jgi:hypothetical protein